MNSEFVDLMIADGTVVDIFGEFPGTSIAIADGRIAAMGTRGAMPPARQVIEANGHYILPGVIDAHVHLREPGLGYKEGYFNGTGSAALGGVTCIFDMPNSEPPINNLERFQEKLDHAKGRAWVDYAFYGLLGPGDAGQAGPLADAGAIGMKAFLGQSESGPGCPLPPDDGELYEAMEVLAARQLRLAVHAENHSLMRRRIAALKEIGADGLDAHLHSRPVVAELEAINRVGIFAKATGCRVHIVHVSSGAGIAAVRNFKSAGVAMSAETCPHYLLYSDVPTDQTLLRVNPPIRGAADCRALIAALRGDGIDYVASDHAPHHAAEKKADSVWQVRPGLIGVQHVLQLLWSRRAEWGLSISDIVRLTSFAPARAWGLWPRKGAICCGSDADLVVIDPDRPWVIDEQSIFSLHRTSPYSGLAGQGIPVVTTVRGKVVMRDGSLVGDPAGDWVPGPCFSARQSSS